MTGEVDTEDNKSNGDALTYLFAEGAVPSTPGERLDWNSTALPPPVMSSDASIIGEFFPKSGMLLSGEDSRNLDDVW